MKLTDLAAKQKRLLNWAAFAETETSDAGLAQRTLSKVSLLRNALANCWERQQITAEDEIRIESLERELTSLNELARMTVVGKKAS